ncbi:hypothetical protein BC830DRAFT_271614 [Chytriomyces sp. MP71]|nr:hypothetical protein BC830DRAFT_271614 [Chytriomyces sp. MP71]
MQTKHVFIGAKQGTGFGNLTEKEDKPKLCSLATMDPQSLGRAENASSVPQSVFGGLPGLEQSTPIPAIRTPQSFPANSTSRTHPSTLSIPVETETMERPSRTNDHTSIPTRQDRDLTAVTSNFASVRHVVPVIAYSNQGPEMRLSASFSPMSDGDVCKTSESPNILAAVILAVMEDSLFPEAGTRLQGISIS